MTTTTLDAARTRIAQRAREHHLLAIESVLTERAQLRWAVHVGEGESEAVGQLGGELRVPASFDWPAAHGRPMVGWLQIDLARLPAPTDLPPAGLLTVFLAHEPRPGPPGEPLDCDGATAVLFGPDEAVEPRSAPGPSLAERRLSATLRVSVPGAGSVYLADALAALERDEEDRWDREHELPDDELPPEEPVMERFTALMDGIEPPGAPAVVELLGHPAPCQDDPLLEHARQGVGSAGDPFALRQQADRWRLLLQGVVHRSLGYDLLTGGMVYLLVPAHALAQGRVGGVVSLSQR